MKKILIAVMLVSNVAWAGEGDASAAQLAALVKTKGTKVGAPLTSGLESPRSVDVKVKKGYCYTVEVTLAPGAKWKAGGKPSLYLSAWPSNPTTVFPELLGPTGAVFEPNCSERNGTESFGLAMMGPDDVSGSGKHVVQVYERKPSSKELAAETKVLEKARKDSVRERDAGRAKTCGQCASESPSPRDRKICLERRGLTMTDCGW